MNRQGPSDERIVVHADPDIADLILGFLENRRKDVTAMRAALARTITRSSGFLATA